MLRFSIFLCLWASLIPNVPAQEWQQEFPIPTHHEFKDVHSANNWTWLVGEQGTIFASSDGGNNWGQLPPPTSETLNGVYFVDERYGWVVGNNSTILQTNDGGNTWQTQNCPIGLNLGKVQFVDGNTGWAMDTGGEFLRTTDAGSTWLSSTIPGATNLTDFIFINASIGWVIGNSAVWQTIDGGDSWIAQSLSTSFPTLSIHFSDANYGWIGAGSGNFYRTMDGGNNWVASVITLASNYDIEDIHFHDTLNGVALRSNLVMNTTDGGDNWSFLTGGDYDKIYFSDTSHGYAIGGFNSNKDVAITSDGGETLNAVFSTTNQPFQDVAAINNNDLWAVGEAGEYRSVDGGFNWVLQGGNLTPCYEIEFADNGLDGWMITTWLRIYSTHDGGATWTRTSSLGQGVITEQLHELVFIDNLHGWVGSSYGTIYKTTDGGATWTTASGGSSETKVLEFSTTQIGWKRDATGFYKTNDAGTTWQIDTAFNGRVVQDMQFLDASNGWAVGSMNGLAVVMATSDGGTTWTTYPASVASFFGQVAFADTQHGWVTDNHGDIWYSNNGGQNWTAQGPSIDQATNALAASDSAHCWAVGNESTILRYQSCNLGRPTLSENGGILSIPANFQSYQWYLNGNPIGGATQANYTPTNEGVYTVLVTGTGDCQATSYVITINNSAILNTPNIQRAALDYFAVFPNPSQGRFTVKFESSNLPEQVVLQDISGRVLQSFQASDIKPTMQLNFTSLANGIYIITAQNGSGLQSQKVVIQQ